MRAVERLVATVQDMGNEALLEAVRSGELGYGRKVADLLWTKTGGNASRRRAIALNQERWDAVHPLVVARVGDLGWNVEQGGTGQVLQAFPGPEGVAVPTLLERAAEGIVHNRLAQEAMDWLTGYEMGGAARERAQRKVETQ